jgi:hypothetical protein
MEKKGTKNEKNFLPDHILQNWQPVLCNQFFCDCCVWVNSWLTKSNSKSKNPNILVNPTQNQIQICRKSDSTNSKSKTQIC